MQAFHRALPRLRLQVCLDINPTSKSLAEVFDKNDNDAIGSIFTPHWDDNDGSGGIVDVEDQDVVDVEDQEEEDDVSTRRHVLTSWRNVIQNRWLYFCRFVGKK